VGTEAFWVPLALTALSGGAEYANQKGAAKRADSAQAQSIIDQGQLQQKAAGDVNKTLAGIQGSNPNAIASKATGDYVATLRKNAAGAATGGAGSSLAPVVGGSSRYKGDVKQAQTAVSDFGDERAGDLGQLDAAVRQRQNEGLSMQDLGTQLNQIGAQSYGTNFVDQLRAQQAGQANPWVSLFAGMLKNGAGAYATNAGGKTPSLSGKAAANRFGSVTDYAPPANAYGGALA
jgi:hypothetical protein